MVCSMITSISLNLPQITQGWMRMLNAFADVATVQTCVHIAVIADFAVR